MVLSPNLIMYYVYPHQYYILKVCPRSARDVFTMLTFFFFFRQLHRTRIRWTTFGIDAGNQKEREKAREGARSKKVIHVFYLDKKKKNLTGLRFSLVVLEDIHRRATRGSICRMYHYHAIAVV